MVRVIAWLLVMVTTLVVWGPHKGHVITFPPKPSEPPVFFEDEEYEWRMYNHEAYDDYVLEFNEIFAAVQVKRSKDNRVMVKGINDKSFKAKKG